ncbi:hypothetical protein L218DRAFT_949551 [Marasmius fiardii PR-910]|nr:hypothetical protein L218DRAFT_949551 [Marasmius fiardii PR-910]
MALFITIILAALLCHLPAAPANTVKETSAIGNNTDFLAARAAPFAIDFGINTQTGHNIAWESTADKCTQSGDVGPATSGFCTQTFTIPTQPGTYNVIGCSTQSFGIEGSNSYPTLHLNEMLNEIPHVWSVHSDCTLAAGYMGFELAGIDKSLWGPPTKLAGKPRLVLQSEPHRLTPKHFNEESKILGP